MNITGFEFTQAFIEIVGAAVCLISALVLRLNGVNKITRNIRNMFFCACIMLVCDANAYVFRGNTQTFAVIMTRVCNYGNFLMNVILLALAAELPRITVNGDDGTKKDGRLMVSVNILCLVEILLLMINVFTGIMFSFDADNYYHRNYGWYVYTVIALIIMLITVIYAVRNRKILGNSLFWPIMVYEFLPILLTLVQSLFYGISISTIGVAAGLVVVMYAYYFSWNGGKISKRKIGAHEKYPLIIFSSILVLIVGMTTAFIISANSFRTIYKQNETEENKAVTQMIKNEVEKEIVNPILVCRTLGCNHELLSLLDELNENPDADIADETSKCLSTIKNNFGYTRVFAVSDINKAYYTEEGLHKTLDPENNEADSWYDSFIDEDRDYDLSIAVSSGVPTIFVDKRMNDEDGNLLGVCGVGFDFSTLEEKLAAYENQYNIKIYISDTDGLVQISSDSSDTDCSYVDSSYFDSVTADSLYVDKADGIERITSYIPDYDLMLVVTFTDKNTIYTARAIFPSLLIFFAAINIMVAVFIIMIKKERNTREQSEENRQAAISDELTGTLNRRAYEMRIDTIMHDDPTKIAKSGLTAIMCDINGLKTANDTLGHKAGDELIIGAADSLKAAFGDYGEIYRVGGDEFAVLLFCTVEQLDKCLTKLDEICSEWHGSIVSELAISKGCARALDYEGSSIRELLKIADGFMYKDKDEYYKRTGKERRTSGK